MANKSEPIPLRVGISTCLLGERVRWDGGHKRDRFVTDLLAEYFDFVPTCPEVEIGMGTPREAVRLVGTPDEPRMVGGKTGTDWTRRMKSYATRRTRELSRLGLSGYIFKKRSPSCGIERVRVYSASGQPGAIGRGLYADAIIEHLPLLPVEDEGRLHDARLRENFIECVFAYHRLQNLFAGRFSRREVVRFHAAHKYLLLAHSPSHQRQLGKLVAAVSRYQPREFREQYCTLFMEAMRIKTTTKKHVNVLQHILGFLKERLAPEDRAYIVQIIEDFRREFVPLIVPVALLKHYVYKYNISYIMDQYYLDPHPKELKLRNHV